MADRTDMDSTREAVATRKGGQESGPYGPYPQPRSAASVLSGSGDRQVGLKLQTQSGSDLYTCHLLQQRDPAPL